MISALVNLVGGRFFIIFVLNTNEQVLGASRSFFAGENTCTD